MGLGDRLENLSSPGKSGSDTRSLNTPEAWRPRLEVDESGGFLISTPKPAGQIPDAENILREFDLDPLSWSVTSVRKSRWQTYNGEWLEAARISIQPAATIAAAERLDAEKLIEEIRKWRPERGIRQRTGEGAYIVVPSDQQIGKRANGQGTQQSIDRLLQLTESSIQHFEGLTKAGLNLGTIVLALPGDHVEGNVSQNGRLQGLAASDLGLTEQVRVARRLLMSQIKALSPMAERMVVPVVNGNHDEVTRQVAADPADGWNVEIASAVQDACAENQALAHVEFRYPAPGHQTLAVDINGTMLGLFHGHQMSQNGPEKYLQQQSLGQTALGLCDVWVSGHYHNFRTMDIGHRLWLQCPTTDPGSEWYRDKAGAISNPGLLTFVMGGDYNPREFISVLPVRS